MAGFGGTTNDQLFAVGLGKNRPESLLNVVYCAYVSNLADSVDHRLRRWP